MNKLKQYSIFSILYFFMLHTLAAAPLSVTTGRVIDAKTNEPLPGATVSIPELKMSAVTNSNGEFTFNSAPAKGKFLVEARFVGYKAMSMTVNFPQDKLEFALEPTVEEIHEVVVTGTAASSSRRQNSTSVTTVNRAQLLGASTNVVDAIARQAPGVSQITTGQAISKPVIRGLGYNRVVTLNDGVKQQGQQWGDEHGIEIDQFAPERVEVLRGAASLLYGSDALGGVINFIEPVAAPEGTVRGEALSNYSTNNGLTSSSLMLTGNTKGFVWLGRETYKNAYSFKTPTGYFPNSGFNENNVSAMIGLNKQWGYSHLNFSWFRNNIGFYEPQFDGGGNYVDDEGNGYTSADYKSRGIDFPRQDIGHFKLAWNSNFLTGNGYVKVDLGYQDNTRKELDGPDPSLFFDLGTYSADIKYYITKAEGWQPVFGFSTDKGHSVNKGQEFLVPDYDSFGIGAFGYAKRLFESGSINFGLRYDYRSNKGKGLVDGATTVFSPFTNDFSSVSGAFGFTHELGEQVNLKANLGSAFRAPNPPELGSNGVHEGTFRYEVGNSSLKPERSYQADISVDVDGEIVSGSLGIYNNYIHNYIYASNKPGDDITVTDPGGSAVYPVYRYGQVNADLYGFDGNLTIHPASFIHLENIFSYTHAQNNDLDRPLPFIPAATVRNVLRIEPAKGNVYFYVSLDNYFTQDRVDATFETPTDSYSLLGAGLGKKFKLGKQSLKFQASVTNLTDKKYYSALSRLKPGRLDQTDPTLGVYDPGRNVTVGLYLPFAF